MRAPAALGLLLAALLAACAEPAPEAAAAPPPDDEPRRTSRGGGSDGSDESDENRTDATLGSYGGGPVDAGRHPFSVVAPPGGAVAVTWELSATPGLSLVDSVEGPGCDWSRFYLPAGPMDGECADLDEGAHEFAVVLNEPALDFRFDVYGLVLADGPAGPTET